MTTCKHGRRKDRCKECDGSGLCEHKKQRTRCRLCNGSGICEHNRLKYQCKECCGAGICEHGKRKSHCKKCKGSQICEHGRQKFICKECGNVRFDRFLKGSFTVEEIKAMGAMRVCQFPNCLVQSNRLNSDHYHDGQKINPNNYRGEICAGHNRLLVDLDSQPDWASKEVKEYMLRRPYKRNLQSN